MKWTKEKRGFRSPFECRINELCLRLRKMRLVENELIKRQRQQQTEKPVKPVFE
jgi:hypothetical protein